MFHMPPPKCQRGSAQTARVCVGIRTRDSGSVVDTNQIWVLRVGVGV